MTELKSPSLRIRTSLEAAEQLVTRLTSTCVTWRVYGMRRIFRRHPHLTLCQRHLFCLRVANWSLSRCHF